MSTVSPYKIIASTPNAQEVLIIVPKFPASFMFSSRITFLNSGFHFCVTCFPTATHLGAEVVVDIFDITDSVTSILSILNFLLNPSIVNKCMISIPEPKASSIHFSPSSINKPLSSLYFFC